MTTVPSTPESGHRGGYDGHKKKRGSKLHMVVDTLGELLTLQVTAANVPERTQVEQLVEKVQQMIGEHIEVLYADQGYSGADAAAAAAKHGIQLQVVPLPKDRKGFVLVPRRWVVERSFTWLTRIDGWRVTMNDWRRPSSGFICAPPFTVELHDCHPWQFLDEAR